MILTLSANSVKTTESIGAHLAENLITANIRRMTITLDGELGVGKTAFTRGFCSALGISGVKSPTYTVVNEYRGEKVPVFHFDMYRLADEDDLLSVGYDEYLARDGYLLAEWAERVCDMLPDERIAVTIARTDADTGRRITLKAPDALAARLPIFDVKE